MHGKQKPGMWWDQQAKWWWWDLCSALWCHVYLTTSINACDLRAQSLCSHRDKVVESTDVNTNQKCAQCNLEYVHICMKIGLFSARRLLPEKNERAWFLILGKENCSTRTKRKKKKWLWVASGRFIAMDITYGKGLPACLACLLKLGEGSSSKKMPLSFPFDEVEKRIFNAYSPGLPKTYVKWWCLKIVDKDAV